MSRVPVIVHRKGFHRRITQTALVALLILAGHSAGGAPARRPEVEIAITKDAYWYPPDGKVSLDVTVENKGVGALEDAAIRLRVHTRNRAREELDPVLEGKPRRSYAFTKYLKRGITLKPGKRRVEADVPLSDYGLRDGVYPVSVEVLEEGTVVGSSLTELIVMSAVDPAYTPLKLAIVFDVSEPPHRLSDGDFKDDVLASECRADGKKPGWLACVFGGAVGLQDMRLSFSVSPMLLEELADMADGFKVRSDGGTESRPADSPEAVTVSRLLDDMRRMAGKPEFQFLSTPYSSPDLEQLCARGWVSDARGQISRGVETLESVLKTAMTRDFYYPPGLNLDSYCLRELDGDLGSFLLLGPQLLQRSREGQKLAGGMTLGSPLRLEGAADRQTVALFADARLDRLIRSVGSSEDAHGVAQVFLSDLTNLYLERPARRRVCVFHLPGNWRPRPAVLGALMEAISGAPWLQTVTLGEGFLTVPTLENTELKIPAGKQDASSRKYFDRVGSARREYLAFKDIVFKDNRLPATMLRTLYTAQSDVWRQWGRERTGLTYAKSISEDIRTQLAMVDMPESSTVTLTSRSADIPLTVVNGTGYRIKARFALSGNGLAFPEGSRPKVVLAPKENVFEIPVRVTKGGRVRFAATLEAGGFLLGRTETTVRTGRLSTFAIVLVAGLLGFILLIWALRIWARRKAARHKKKRRRGGQTG